MGEHSKLPQQGLEQNPAEIECILALKSDIYSNNFNHFPQMQLIKYCNITNLNFI